MSLMKRFSYFDFSLTEWLWLTGCWPRLLKSKTHLHKPRIQILEHLSIQGYHTHTTKLFHYLKCNNINYHSNTYLFLLETFHNTKIGMLHIAWVTILGLIYLDNHRFLEGKRCLITLLLSTQHLCDPTYPLLDQSLSILKYTFYQPKISYVLKKNMTSL